MPRKKRCRRVGMMPGVTFYKPAGKPLREINVIELGFDEFEALRLADMEGLYHEDAAGRMNISRQTFGRVVQSARHKIASAIVEGKGIRFENKENTITV